MAGLTLPSSLVSVAWLQQHYQEKNVLILDATWHLPAAERDGRSEWQERRIPGAQFFDYDAEIKDHQSALPRMMPSAELFTQAVQRLGVSRKSVIIIYDANGLFSSPRAWWMFRAMGHSAVAVLDGGLQAWQEAGYELETQTPRIARLGNFKAALQEDFFVDAERVLAAIQNEQVRICDARSAERFASGHMPTAQNLPYTELLEHGRMKDLASLRALFQQRLTDEQRLLCSCGSGVTACVLALAADLIGRTDISVYDASWSEWGSNTDYPQVTAS